MKKYLIAGLLVWLPLAVTVWVLNAVLGTLSGVFDWITQVEPVRCRRYGAGLDEPTHGQAQNPLRLPSLRVGPIALAGAVSRLRRVEHAGAGGGHRCNALRGQA